MKKNFFIVSFLLLNLLIMNKITAQTPIRFRAENGNIGLYDEVNNKILTKENYSRISEFSEGIARANTGSFSEDIYLTKKGQEIGDGYFSSYSDCKNGLILVKATTNKYEYINKIGKKAFQGTFYEARNFSDGYAVIAKSANDIGFIDISGKFCFETQLKKIKGKLGKIELNNFSNFSNGKAVIKSEDGKMLYFLNNKGVVVDMSDIMQKILSGTFAPNGLEKLSHHNIFGSRTINKDFFEIYCSESTYVFDSECKFIGHFEYLGSIGHQRFLVIDAKGDRYFIDSKGSKISTNMAVESVFSYDKDYIILKNINEIVQGQAYTIFNKDLKKIEIKNIEKYSKQEDEYLITLENGKQIITNFGEARFIVPSVPLEELLVEGTDDKYAFNKLDHPLIIKNKGKFGAINQQGKLIVPCEYDQISPFEGNYFTTATKNGKKMKITRNNKILD